MKIVNRACRCKRRRGRRRPRRRSSEAVADAHGALPHSVRVRQERARLYPWSELLELTDRVGAINGSAVDLLVSTSGA